MKVTAKAEADSTILPEFYLLAGTMHLDSVPIAQPGWSPLFRSPEDMSLLNRGETRSGWVTFDAPKLSEYELVLLDPSTAEKRASWKLTPATTPVTTQPSNKANKAKLGSTQRYESSDGLYAGRSTVLRYRDSRDIALLPKNEEAELRARGKRSVSIEVRVCVTKSDGEEPTQLRWLPWTLGDDQGGSYEDPVEFPDNATVQPQYPDGKVTPVGVCRRGWILFEVPRNARPTLVEYSPGDGDPLIWQIKK